MQIEEKPVYDTYDHPNLVIKEIKDLYHYRTLVAQLTRRNVIARYKRSILGVGWTLLEPLVTMIVMAIIFSSIFGRTMKAYPVFLLSGLIVWNFISQGSTSAITDLLNGSWLISKVYMPRTIFAVTAISANLINWFFALIPLFLLFIYFGLPFTPAFIFLPISVLIITLFTVGLGLLSSALAVYFADVLNIHQIALRLIMYLSGIFYVVENLPESARPIILLNPLYNLMVIFRNPIYYGQMPSNYTIGYASLWSLGMFLAGLFIFLRISKEITFKV
jgi:ABC-type polysaccharide/polyol phosphate export permease